MLLNYFFKIPHNLIRSNLKLIRFLSFLVEVIKQRIQVEFIKTVVILLSQIKNAIKIKLTSCEESKIQPDTPLRDWRASRNAHQNAFQDSPIQTTLNSRPNNQCKNLQRKQYLLSPIAYLRNHKERNNGCVSVII